MELKRSVSKIPLLFVSVGTMCGSGWMLASLYAAQIAGPAAIISWVLGGLLVMVVALTFSELSSMLPLSGGIARFPQFSHGTLVSFTMTWLAWLAYSVLAPTEIQGLLQYSVRYFPWLMHDVAGKPSLTGSGLSVAVGLLFLMSLLNVFGIRFVTKLNTIMVWFKIVVPVITAALFLWVGFHASNFTAHGGFVPYGFRSIIVALPAAGIVFSYFGFRFSMEIAGESTNPQRDIPLSLLGSLVIVISLYTLIQFALIGAFDPNHLVHGWRYLDFHNDEGPVIAIAAGLGLGWLIILLYVNSIISPFSSAFMVVTTNSRVNYAMGINRALPYFLTKLNKHGVPARAIWINFVIGSCLFLPFPGWQKLAAFVISAVVMSHTIAPVSLVALRRQIPNMPRPFQLPYATQISFAAFVILNLLAFWTGWATMWKMYLAGAVGLVLFSIYQIFRRIKKLERVDLNVKQAIWLLPYFMGMAVISYLGSFGGGIGVISFGIDFVVIIAFSAVIFFWGTTYCLSNQETQKQINEEKHLEDILSQLNQPLDDVEII